MAADLAGPVLGLAVALGGGLLIGLERERRKGRGRDRQAAGVRSFAIAAFGGALAQATGEPLLVALGALAVVALAAIAYRSSRVVPDARDPGLTTELALVVTYLVGVLSVQQPALGGAAGVVTALLLAARERLHRFATRVLSEAELHDALLLAALALVVLPLLPAGPLPWAGLRPRALGGLLVLILALQALGHVALRVFGARAGLALAGLFAGFVSSTAAIASLGTRARAEPAQQAACEAGAMLSTAATWLLAAALVAAASPSLAARLAPAIAAGGVVAAAGGLWRAAGAHSASMPALSGGPLHLRQALAVALLLGGASLVVGWAQALFGSRGVLIGAMVSALADAHSSIAALATLHQGGRLAGDDAVLGVLLAVTTNAVMRGVTAVVAGGPRYGARLGLSLAASTAAAWGAVALTGLPFALRAPG